jgi:hypothetical protein
MHIDRPHGVFAHAQDRRRMPRGRVAMLAASLGAALVATYGASLSLATSTELRIEPRSEAASEKSEKKVDVFPTQDALVIAGLMPETLAAAGLGPAEVTELIAFSRGEMQAQGVRMATAMSVWQSASTRLQALQDRVVSGRASEAERGQLAILTQDYAQAEMDRANEIEQFRAAVLATLPGSARAALDAVHAQAGTGLAPQYAVTPWVARTRWDLRNAASAQAIAQREGVPLASSAVDVLAAASADPTVNAAIENTGTNLAAIQAVWDAEFAR